MELKNDRESLESRIEQFIGERSEMHDISLKRIAGYRLQLVGSTVPFIHIGYIRFLKSFGVPHPEMDDLCGFFIGRYWEFLTQHHGALAAQSAMSALRAFWKWAAYNGYILRQPMPTDLKDTNIKVAKPYRVKITITETN